MKRRTRIIVGLTILAVLFLVHKFVLTSTLVVGISMTPTLQPWDYCLTLRTNPYRPQRGDIVTFRDNTEPPQYFIKRVVGLPGETIAISNGLVSINGEPLPEPHTKINPEWQLPATVVASNKIYVLSDRRVEGFEDYVQGAIAIRLVKSKLLWHWRWKKQ
jgi:signal peptidase I